MGDFNRFNGADFARMGFTFATPGETALFSEVLQEELEVRVGQEVGRNLTDAQIEEFDRCQDMAESAFWLEQNCPGYKEIVQAEKARLEHELLEYRSMIPGAMAVPPPELGGVTVEELGLSTRSFNRLKRAGINTVGDIACNGRLSNIRNLRQCEITEISAKLWELMGMFQNDEELFLYDDGDDDDDVF